MKHLRLYEEYSETELTEYKGLDVDEIHERSKEYVQYRRSLIRKGFLLQQTVKEVDMVIIRNDGTIYISWIDENDTTYHHNVPDENDYYKFIEDPELYKTAKKYNL